MTSSPTSPDTLPSSDIKEQLGHHSITLTVDTYGHRLRDDRKAVDGLDEVATSDLSDHPDKVVAER